MKSILLSLTLCSLVPVAMTSCSTSNTFAQARQATAQETTLLQAINSARRAAGKRALSSDQQLTALAQAESAAAAARGQLPGNITQRLVQKTGRSIGQLTGQLTDRGPETAGQFVDYWKSSDQDTLMGDWSEVGVGIGKTALNKLIPMVIFGGSISNATNLNEPMTSPGAMMPGGF